MGSAVTDGGGVVAVGKGGPGAVLPAALRWQEDDSGS